MINRRSVLAGGLALYAKLKLGETAWSKPTVLADTPEGLGVASPAIASRSRRS